MLAPVLPQMEERDGEREGGRERERERDLTIHKRASLSRTPSLTIPTRAATRNLGTVPVYLTPDSGSRAVGSLGLALACLTQYPHPHLYFIITGEVSRNTRAGAYVQSMINMLVVVYA